MRFVLQKCWQHKHHNYTNTFPPSCCFSSSCFSPKKSTWANIIEHNNSTREKSSIYTICHGIVIVVVINNIFRVKILMKEIFSIFILGRSPFSVFARVNFLMKSFWDHAKFMRYDILLWNFSSCNFLTSQ